MSGEEKTAVSGEEEFLKNLFGRGETDQGDEGGHEGKEGAAADESVLSPEELEKKAEEERIQKEKEDKEKEEIERLESAERERQRQVEIDEIRFKARVFEENMKRKEEEEAKRKKKEDMERERAAVDQGDDDSEAEIQAREQAKKMLAEYSGNVFDAAQQDSVELVRAFFLVHGSKKLLKKRDQTPHGGNTSLLHTASFWGSNDVLAYLIKLGANPNERDSMYSGVTPLLEAARAGLPLTCSLLLKAGADVSARDKQDNTFVHWCARKGWGSMTKGVLKTAEKAKPGSTRGLLTARNVKNYTPVDVAANVTVQNLIGREIKRYGEAAQKRKGVMKKMKKGLLKAKIMGADIGQKKLAAVKAKQRRYSSRSKSKPKKKESKASVGESENFDSFVSKRASFVNPDASHLGDTIADLGNFAYSR